MDKETKDIVTLIAGIQIESLLSLKEEINDNPKKIYPLLQKLLEIKSEDIHMALDKHIQIYTEIENRPNLINLLSEYQIMICSHILFKMEDEWIQTNSQGVMGCWELIRDLSLKRHPELKLLIN